MSNDPHQAQPVLHAGVPLAEASGAVVLVHGRGGSAEDILSLSQPLYHSQLAYLAPQAAGRTWYPYSFLAPIAENEPWLTSAIRKIAATVQTAIDAGVPRDRIFVCGFSQGACLATEFVARNPARYAGLIGFTGGLIGPPEADLAHAGDLAGTPVFLGSSDPDPHVPWKRVEATAKRLREMNAVVTTRRYEGMPHTINPEELEFGRRLIHDVLEGKIPASR
ncbi:alpha/beta hydrolase [Edaphobacter bradus]|uniref:alpha/beta hydrolase n=1 Tax=Edaphobacter bradus TaxID=2259016 RepID=UPI0021E033DE|nr:dienelactone hydrolase family protein [Edaphobacter bradus]